MAARLGEVLFWLFGSIGVVMFVFVSIGLVLMERRTPDNLIMAIGFGYGPAVIFYIFGRACRYVLAGR